MYTPFSVKCTHCGHRNKPKPGIRDGIKAVLSGEFITCRKCGYEFNEITVPTRPLVMKVYKEMNNLLKEQVNTEVMLESIKNNLNLDLKKIVSRKIEEKNKSYFHQ